jgi:hypothetical protein
MIKFMKRQLWHKKIIKKYNNKQGQIKNNKIIIQINNKKSKIKNKNKYNKIE